MKAYKILKSKFHDSRVSSIYGNPVQKKMSENIIKFQLSKHIEQIWTSN